MMQMSGLTIIKTVVITNMVKSQSSEQLLVGIMTAEVGTLLLLKKSKTAQSLSPTLLMADRTFIFLQQRHQTLMQAVIAGGIFRDIST